MTNYVNQRRVIEGVRAGVPTRGYAGLCLPKAGSILAESFEQKPLKELWSITGDYGVGKSHSLFIAESHALKKNWVCSLVPTGPSLPLSKPLVVARQAALVACKSGTNDVVWSFVLEIVTSAQLEEWQHWCQAHCSPWISTWSLLVQQSPTAYRLACFWHGLGEKMPAEDLGKVKRHIGLTKFPPPDNWRDAFSLLTALAKLVEICYSTGWLILLDEIELHLKMPRDSRLLMYQAVGELKNIVEQEVSPQLSFGLATTDGLLLQSINGKDSAWKEVVHGRSKFEPDKIQLGMEAIKSSKPIYPPEAGELESIQHTLWTVYCSVYGNLQSTPWEVKFDGKATIRERVRMWINTWDAKRLNLSLPAVSSSKPHFDLSEESQDYSVQFEV